MQTFSQIIEAIEGLDLRLRTFFESEINLTQVDDVFSGVEQELQTIMGTLNVGSASLKEQTKPAIEVLLQTIENGRSRIRIRIDELERDIKGAQQAKTALQTYATHMHGSARS